MSKVLRTIPDPTVSKLLDKVICTAESIIIPEHYTISKKQFLDIPIPVADTPKDFNYESGTLTGFASRYLLAAKTLLKAQHIRNYRYAYPESYLNWHTDSDFVGKRLYYTYTDHEAIFKYSSNNTIKLDYDAVGAWTCRSFDIVENELFWHSSWNKGLRYVFGFSL